VNRHGNDREPRSFLYAPGDRRDILAKLHTRGADCVIVDLEDAVALGSKNVARSAVLEWRAAVTDSRTDVWLRINNELDHLEEDLRVCRMGQFAGVIVPKVEGRDRLTEILNEADGIRAIALVESGHGLLKASEIASTPGLTGLAIGEADLSADLGIEASDDEHELLPARMAIVTASAAAGLRSPMGPAWSAVSDVDGLVRTSESLKRMGFGSRAAIHPSQVPAINRVFSTEPSRVKWAQGVIARAESGSEGAFLDENGSLVDEAVLKQARRAYSRRPR